jgi:hypothetical protein
MDAAKRFFSRALAVVGHAPEKVTTDGHDAYPRAIRETLGSQVHHRCSRYMNNRIEQDHRGIKGRYSPIRGFGSFDSAARFCLAHDEVRNYFRHRTRLNEAVPLRVQRDQFCTRLAALRGTLQAASATSEHDPLCSYRPNCLYRPLRAPELDATPVPC